ncbi:hypothetical protein [Frankia sp. AvcI1]|uniref:hypothetical protein n=1 Tax=Frankia sp. AvcI1 TaxID=573496 RepID=UPI002117E87C|nr:hypothetical protein [Frankia sp. AvcI1]
MADEGAAGTGTGDSGTAAERTFSQADLDRIGAREKAQGRKAAAAELAEALGMSVDDAKRIIGEHQARAHADKTEVQRAAEARQAAELAAATAQAEAAQVRHGAAVERALLLAGVALPEDGADEALAGVARLVTAEPGADAAAITAAVTALKGRFPGLFAKPVTGAGGASGDPGPGPRGQNSGGKSGLAAGLARAEAAAKARPSGIKFEATRPALDYTRR